MAHRSGTWAWCVALTRAWQVARGGPSWWQVVVAMRSAAGLACALDDPVVSSRTATAKRIAVMVPICRVGFIR